MEFIIKDQISKKGVVDFRISYWKIELRTQHFWKNQIELKSVLENRLLQKKSVAGGRFQKYWLKNWTTIPLLFYHS